MTYLCVILFIVEPWNLSGGLMGSIPLVCSSVRLFMCLILCIICHEFAQSVAHCSTNFTLLGLFVAFFLLIFYLWTFTPMNIMDITNFER